MRYPKAPPFHSSTQCPFVLFPPTPYNQPSVPWFVSIFFIHVIWTLAKCQENWWNTASAYGAPVSTQFRMYSCAHSWMQFVFALSDNLRHLLANLTLNSFEHLIQSMVFAFIFFLLLSPVIRTIVLFSYLFILFIIF